MASDYVYADSGIVAYPMGSTAEQATANARLISAAPELLEALILAENVLSRFPYSTELWPNGTHPNTGIEQIRKAIEKATSGAEHKGRVCDYGPTYGGPDAESRADGRLIAAAPELLSIAQRWRALDYGGWHPERHARDKDQLLADTDAAIALAELLPSDGSS